jgi:hypothetical protein
MKITPDEKKHCVKLSKKNKVIEWLLEENNPPVKFLTLKNLLHIPDSDSVLQQVRINLTDYKITQGILINYKDFLKNENRDYWKYTGKYWQLIFLGQFHANGKEKRVAEIISNILSQDKWIIKNGGQCLTANILVAFMRLGYSDHPTVIEETESLARRINSDRGIKCTAMDYSLMPHCYMALPKLLLCFGEIPEEKRSLNVRNAIDLIIKTLIENEVYVYVPSNRKKWQKILEKQPKRADLPKGQTVKEWTLDQKEKFLATNEKGTKEPKQGWLRFGFPLHYNSDILEALYALAYVNAPMHPNFQKPLQVIKDKKTSEDQWILENSLNGKMWIDVEEKGKPSKWLTYFALYVLNHFEK